MKEIRISDYSMLQKFVKENFPTVNIPLEECEKALVENIKIRDDITTNFSSLSTQVQEYSNKTEEVQNEIYELMNTKAECKTKIERVETLLEQVNINKVQLNQKLLK